MHEFSINVKFKKVVFSGCTFCKDNDPKGILKSMLTAEAFKTFNSNSVPPHKLYSAVDGVCIEKFNIKKSIGR